MKSVRFTDIKPFIMVEHDYKCNPVLVNIRGCNGAGKSTVPIRMLETDKDAYEITWHQDNKDVTLATVFPSYNTIALGHYHSKCGGLDSVKNTDTIKKSVEALWCCKMNIIMEGILPSTVRGTYIDLFQKMIDDHKDWGIQREVIIYNILPPLEVCLQRIQARNGGKPIKENLVDDKWKTVKNNVKYFRDAGFTSIEVSNENIDRVETLGWYYSNIGATEQFERITSENRSPILLEHHSDTNKEHTSKENASMHIKSDKKPTKEQMRKALPKYSGEPEELYIPTEDDIDGYDWSEYYVEPDPGKVVVNWDNMRFYWYWIHERMKIWYNRVILRKPAPWTNDEILRDNKFTNVIRDLDRGTILYIRNILSKMDEPGVDLVKRAKEVILNTQIYRMFIKKETMDNIGWFLTLDNWDEDWARAKSAVRKMKKSGETVWHAAYYVNDLKAANPDESTNSDKVENVICMIDDFHDSIDDTYEFITTHNMKDCLEYLVHFPAVAYFTVYEWLCDWGMAYKHIKHPFVEWTDDSYVNIGPGNKRGLDYVFEDKGNLDYYQLNFYLRASWKHYMQRYGYYDDFVKMLPEWCAGDINMRVIEHDLCELQKYLGVHYGVGKCRGKFRNESKNNLDSLIL